LQWIDCAAGLSDNGFPGGNSEWEPPDPFSNSEALAILAKRLASMMESPVLRSNTNDPGFTQGPERTMNSVERLVSKFLT